MIKQFMGPLAVMVTLSLPAHVAAQDNASDTVDVTVTIVSPQTAITVDGTAELLFGTVMLPGESAASCTYSVFPSGGVFISADGDKASCGFRNAAQEPGAFEIACESDASLQLSITFQDLINVGQPGIVFSTTEFDTSLDGQPYDGNFVCDGDGVSELTIGGALLVTDEARQTFEPVRVGAITLEATY